MAAVVKKPPATGRETPTGGTPPRPTSRASTTSSAAAATAAGMTRRGSVRTATPVSARAAASQRRESLLGNVTTNLNGTSAADVEREEALRAETVALLDDLKDRLSKAETASETYKRQTEVLQSRLDEALKEQAKLEEKVHENEEQIEWLTNEKREGARQMREMESIYEAERGAMMKEKEDMANREEEMQTVIQRLKDSLAQRNLDDDRPTRQSATNSPSLDSGSFAPPSSLHRSDSRNNSKLVLQKDKMIESLRLELAEAQIKLVETENQGGGRVHEVERLLMEARMANARLMEDNESYQLLLQERTLKGDFGASDFSYMSATSNQDALAALEGRSSAVSLADELSEAAVNEPAHHPQENDAETQRRLETEIKTVKDQNKALTLYINKIIERLLQHQDFEHILDQSNDFKSGPDTNKDLPPPPGRQATGTSLLQRAKSMAIGAGPTTKTRPRPMSIIQPAGAPGTTAHTNPETAPSIPIGLTRSASTRRGRPMSEQYTGGAASVVNAMYRGAPDGPLSPSLRSSQTFFPQQQQQGQGQGQTSGPGKRASSGASSAHTVPYASSGNFPGMKSETSSTSGESIHGDVTTPPSHSPPRSHHEKSTTFAGNKPRPLRLVQENADATAAANALKRQSWIGWASSAFVKKEDGTYGEAIRE